jgi:UDP-N-acetyl-D-glucosamine dehydrogenase
MRVVVVGQGYVGLPFAVHAARVGHDVVGYDVDARRVAWLVRGESYVEGVPPAELRAALASGRYRPAAQEAACAGFDIAVITVPTPLRDSAPDLSCVEAAAATLSAYVRPGTTVILESTTYPGTTRELFTPLLEKGCGLTAGVDFHVGYSPERIDPGNATWGLRETPKIVSGLTAESLAAVRGFYDTLVDVTVPVATVEEAELAKLIENTFRHVNVALMNELAMSAHEMGIDIWKAIDAAATKPFGFMRFTPGPGVGGHCLPVDPSYLSWRVERTVGQAFRFVDLANDINSRMPRYVVERLAAALNTRRRAVNGSRVLLLGLAYKRNTGDARESPAVRVAKLLVDLGAQVSAVDPHVVEDPPLGFDLARVELSEAGLRRADAVVLLTDHDDLDYALVGRTAPYVLDCRRRLPAGPNVEAL